jgi:hypothetical protein
VDGQGPLVVLLSVRAGLISLDMIYEPGYFNEGIEYLRGRLNGSREYTLSSA